MKAIELPEAVLVCMPCDGGWPMLMPDNGTGVCKACGRAVQFRPENPVLLEREHGADGFALICLPCATDIGEAVNQPQN